MCSSDLLWCGHACRVFDAWSAGSATASAGRVRGLEQGGRLGVPQGGKWQLQDMLVAGFGAGLASGPGGGHVHGVAV